MATDIELLKSGVDPDLCIFVFEEVEWYSVLDSLVLLDVKRHELSECIPLLV